MGHSVYLMCLWLAIEYEEITHAIILIGSLVNGNIQIRVKKKVYKIYSNYEFPLEGSVFCGRWYVFNISF